MSTRKMLLFEVLVVVLVVAFASGCRFDITGRVEPGQDAEVLPDVVPSICGNGVLEHAETCDGSELQGETCATQGYAGGTLGCTAECEYDVSLCEISETCGDGVVDAGEACDGSDFGGLTCASEAGHAHGTLLCTAVCTVDDSGCHTCGNGFVEGSEMCDGVVLGGRDCVTEGHDGGQLLCSATCQVDASGCFDCGDGVCNSGAGETRALCPVDCGWVAVAAGGSHTCAVSGEGTLWCWGLNDRGQLGDGGTGSRDLATLVPGLTGVVAVSAGDFHTCAALDNGTAWCWGANDLGQLGDGSVVESAAPVQVVGLGNVVEVAAGGEHTCALSGQTLWCWGKNDKGQLGDNTVIPRAQPVPVSSSTGLSLAVSLTAGSKHTCAIAVDGAAWCWGDKGNGRLGDGTNTERHEPAAVDVATGLTTVTAISAGEKHTCAIAAVTGAAWCWGHKGNGRIGDGTDTDQFFPVPVSSSTGLIVASAIAAGLAHTCAVDSAGAAWCWGLGGDGQIGDGGVVDQVLPARVDTNTGLTTVLWITGGWLHTCGLKADNTTWCWGANGDGQLGDGTTTPHELPAPIWGD